MFELHQFKQFLKAIIWFIKHTAIQILDVFHQNYDTFIDEEIFSILGATKIAMKKNDNDIRKHIYKFWGKLCSAIDCGKESFQNC